MCENVDSHFTDLDECLHGFDDCNAAAECINTYGSYKCSCMDGFYGDGFDCLGKVLYCNAL